MSGVVYIRFFGDDWLSGTQDLSLEERGALITIVAMTATVGAPPALDYMRISRRFGCTPGRAKKVIQSLVDLGKISLEGDTINSRRALIETEISQKNSQKQSANASARWSKQTRKSNKNKGTNDAMAMPWQCQPEPEPEPYNNNTPPIPPKGGFSEETQNDEAPRSRSGSPPCASKATPGAKPNPRKTEKPSGRDKAQEAFDAWNELAEQHGLPKALALNDRRAQSLRLRIEETGGIDAWKACIGSIPASDFLMGKATKFKAHLDFLCQPTSWLKLREGVYHDGNPSAVDVKPLTDAEVRERQERRLRLVGA